MADRDALRHRLQGRGAGIGLDILARRIGHAPGPPAKRDSTQPASAMWTSVTATDSP